MDEYEAALCQCGCGDPDYESYDDWPDEDEYREGQACYD